MIPSNMIPTEVQMRTLLMRFSSFRMRLLVHPSLSSIGSSVSAIETIDMTIVISNKKYTISERAFRPGEEAGMLTE